ncbi:MAG: thermosome [Patescibacteria group bacterium]|jgi:thermosome
MAEDVLSEDTQRILGKTAQRNNILAARIISETVKTTLGPKGMDKMLVDRGGSVIVTNDGVTILEEMEIEHPAAKMIVEVAKTQEKEVGDGTTTSVMIAGKLLENAEKLLDQKIHPTVIIKGYRLAEQKAQEILATQTVKITTEEEFSKVAQTAMTGKGAEYLKEDLSMILIEAIKLVGQENNFNIGDIKIEKQKGGSIQDTALIKGVVIDKERVNIDMPQVIENAKIALIEEALEIKTPETEAKISASSPEQMQAFIAQEDMILKNKVSKIKKSGANVIICQKGIDELVQFYLAKENIYALRRVPKTDMQALSKATGARIISKLDELEDTDLGDAERVEEIKYGDDAMTYVTGCPNPKALTILIRGGTNHVIDEIERALEDALGDLSAIIKNPQVVAGGGAIEMELARQLNHFAQTLRGREQLAVEEFAKALEFIPITLAENAGLDPIDVLTELKAAHEEGQNHAGLNLFTNAIEDTIMHGIIEPVKVKTQAIQSATEVATMILRIDDVIAAKRKGGNALKNPSNMMGYE